MQFWKGIYRKCCHFISCQSEYLPFALTFHLQCDSEGDDDKVSGFLTVERMCGRPLKLQRLYLNPISKLALNSSRGSRP